MDVILVPGFWLDASSWDAVLPALRAAGHRPHPMTLPGLESREADRSGITLRDHVAAVVAEIDTHAQSAPVVVVGHSGGGPIVHGAVDARPDKVARAIYVDAGPLSEGASINPELPAENGEIPLPDWSLFDEQSLVGLDDELRAQFRARAVPTPERVAKDPQQLSDERRYDVPITIITCEFTSDEMRKMIESDHPYTREVAKVRNVEMVDLPTGHWPQFSEPEKLADLLVSAVNAAG